MNGGARNGFVVVVVVVVGSLVLFECAPRFDDIPCSRDNHCFNERPYCVRGVCSALMDEDRSQAEGCSDAGGCASGPRQDGGAPRQDGGAPRQDGGAPRQDGGALGESCASADQCGSHHCVGGVCCESACDDEGLCQRCDSLSLRGPGRCGVAKAEAECQRVASACLGKCLVTYTISYCTGSSYSCSDRTTKAHVPVLSGEICTFDGGVLPRPVDKGAFCSAGAACRDGACQGSRWWTSCDGIGNCRDAGDNLDAYSEPVFAAAGASLTSACGTDGPMACDSVNECVGGVLHGAHLCNGTGVCSVPAEPSMSCSGYSCDAVARQCRASCTSNADCAQNWLCDAPVCHWDRDWASWNVRTDAGYAISGDVVTDVRSGLMWQRGTSDAARAWAGAIDYCNTLDLGGHSDWRLPKAIELLSIVDPGRSNPSIDTAAFPTNPGERYWTSTPCVGGASAFHVGFTSGYSYDLSVGASAWARCVR
jgi:hypothetical protein